MFSVQKLFVRLKREEKVNWFNLPASIQGWVCTLLFVGFGDRGTCACRPPFQSYTPTVQWQAVIFFNDTSETTML